MSELEACTFEAIQQAIDKCAFVQANCGEQYERLNFIGFYYCNLNENVPLIILISILFIAIVFNFLGTTADAYLAPALEVLSKRLKLSEAIAGVTLLALANGATDVIAGLVAGGKSEGGLAIAIGGLFGACLFTVTIVLARSIQGGGEIKTDAEGVRRDIFFLLLSSLYFVFLTIINRITWFLSAGFFVIYLVFIGYVIYMERTRNQKSANTKSRWQKVRTHLLKKPKKVASDDSVALLQSGGLKSLWDQVLTPYLLKSIIIKRRRRGLKQNLGNHPAALDELGEGDINKDMEIVKEEATKENAEEEDNSIFGRIMRVYNAPLFFVRNLTMPPFEEENWNVYYVAATPIFGSLFLLWQVGLIKVFDNHWGLWVGYAAVVLSASLFLYLKGRNEDLTINHAGKLAAAAFLVSGLWLNLVANCFMDFLSLITIISGLPLNYLSLTLLAWGNSLDDFFIDYVIAKSGYGKMAVTGVYGGQLFNLMIGFGGAMFLQSLKATIVPDIYVFSGPTAKENVLTCVLVFTLIASLILTFVIGKLRNWIFGRRLMIFLTAFYGTFLVTVSIITFV